MQCSISLHQDIQVDKIAWILDRGVENFFSEEGKRDPPPGSDMLDINCGV
jgi:hypothetical protein